MAMPLCFVVAVSMIKDAFEDYKRHKSDGQENDTEAMLFDPTAKQFKVSQWKNIRVGQIVRLKCDEFIPADLLILSTSDEKGTCYVETKNLDGETNLKIKSANKEMQAIFTNEGQLPLLDGVVTCEGPNNAIYKFEGTIKLPSKDSAISLNADNLLLRGSSLRNTEFVYGVTIYSGHDTKIMQNSASAKYKFSKLELLTNKTIALTLFVQIVLALIGAVVGASWATGPGIEANYMSTPCKADPNAVAVDGETAECVKENWSFGFTLLQQTGTWILIFTNFVPISLMVTLELVKFWQAMFMSKDWTMFDEEQDMSMRAQSSNLNEELGQVEYVFSDKTGTLTCNIMEFKKFTAGKLPYGTGNKATTTQESNVNFDDPKMEEHLKDKNHPNHQALVRTLIFLGVCHTIVIDDRKGTYNAASPDELALVNAAKQFGYEFKGFDKSDNLLVLEKSTGQTLKYQLLNVCEFNSTRKRMSVIVKDPKGKIIVMCKGADSVILERLSKESLAGEVLRQTQEYVDQFAEEGLRTLFLAERVVGQDEYNAWNKEAQAAKLEIKDRDEKVAAVDEKIEVNMELIGATAIEDRL